MIDLADRLRDDKPGLWKLANRHLESAGVVPKVADGEVFDPAEHEASGYEMTDLPDQHLYVAATEECGYVDRGQEIRKPRVIVYRAPGDTRTSR